MTVSEWALLGDARPDVVPVIVRWHGARLAIAAGPCPYLSPEGTCAVYAVRPYRCRIWGCFRTDAQYTDGVIPVAAVLEGRLAESAGVRRAWGRMVDEAAAWGRTHGWGDEHGAAI